MPQPTSTNGHKKAPRKFNDDKCGKDFYLSVKSEELSIAVDELQNLGYAEGQAIAMLSPKGIR